MPVAGPEPPTLAVDGTGDVTAAAGEVVRVAAADSGAGGRRGCRRPRGVAGRSVAAAFDAGDRDPDHAERLVGDLLHRLGEHALRGRDGGAGGGGERHSDEGRCRQRPSPTARGVGDVVRGDERGRGRRRALELARARRAGGLSEQSRERAVGIRDALDGPPCRSCSAVSSSSSGVGGRTRLRNITEQSAPRRSGRYGASLLGESAGQLPQAPVSEHPNRARALAHDRGDVRDVETGDGTEHHRVALPGWQFGDASERGLGVEPAHRGVAGVDAVRGDRCGPERERVDRHRRPARLTAEVVDRTAAGDGEQPRPERGLVAVEARDRGATAAQVSDATSSAASRVVTRR